MKFELTAEHASAIMSALTHMRNSTQLALSAIAMQMQPPAPPAPQPTPQEHAAMMVAQAQQQESQANVAKKAAELNLKRQEMLLS
mgnify:CR=1 FL=1